MRIGVIRGDLPGSVTLQDLESISQFNPPTEPKGQETHIGRPDPVKLTAYLAGPPGVPAGVQGTAGPTFPVTIVTSSNDVIRVKTAGGAFANHAVAAGTYTTMALLVAAVNTALAGSGVVAISDASGTKLVLQSTTPGVGSTITIDTTGAGSSFNASSAGNFGAGGLTFTMPTAASIISALAPVLGTLNVGATAILTNVGASPAAAGVADFIAPKFVETLVAIQSFQKGMIHGYLSATYTPDPNRLPALALGPAISVVQDVDGTSAFTAPLPSISAAVHNTPSAGDLTITGVAMANVEYTNETSIHVSNPLTGQSVKISQKVINATKTGGTQGSVAATSIVIPASLLAGLGSAAGNLVSLQYTSLINTNLGAAANITAVANGLATVTGLTVMNTYAVGQRLRISGAASAANNGVFFIAALVSATSVQITNPYAIAPDANNGSLAWAQVGNVVFVTT